MSPLPDAIVLTRAGLCSECATPCAIQHCAAAHGDPCAACLLGAWHAVGNCPSGATADTPARGGDTAPAAAPGLRGLGDVVALVAEPIARAIGMDKAKCGCARRQAALNRALPFG